MTKITEATNTTENSQTYENQGYVSKGIGSLFQYLTDQEEFLGMGFMVPAGIRLGLADETICLSDEVRIHLLRRRLSYYLEI